MARQKLVPPFLRASLQGRLIALVVLGTVVMLAALAASSWLAVRESIERTLEERRVLARIAADHLAYVLNQNLRYLEAVGVIQ